MVTDRHGKREIGAKNERGIHFKKKKHCWKNKAGLLGTLWFVHMEFQNLLAPTGTTGALGIP